MISLEMARKLKEAGLEWEPKKGDWYWVFGTNSIDLITIDRNDIVPKSIIFLPSLDQLLAEIEKCAYEWCLEQARDKYRLSLWFDQACVYEFRADTPEDAAAEALLWILSQKEA